MSAGGGMFGGEDLSSVLEYTEAHGGGTIAVDSQSGASSSIIEDGAEVAGIGGFSGKESSVSVEWLEERIESGAIAWIYTSGSGGRLRRRRRPGRRLVLRRRRRRLPHRLGIGDRHRGQVLHQGRLLRSTNPSGESTGTDRGRHPLPMQRFVT